MIMVQRMPIALSLLLKGMIFNYPGRSLVRGADGVHDNLRRSNANAYYPQCPLTFCCYLAAQVQEAQSASDFFS
jgi:hypothetical protein